MPFSDISQNDKITFSGTKSYPDCLPVGNAEKVYLFRYLITRRRGLNHSKQLFSFFVEIGLLIKLFGWSAFGNRTAGGGILLEGLPTFSDIFNTPIQETRKAFPPNCSELNTILCVQSGRELGLCTLLCASLHLVGTSPKRTPQRAVSSLRPEGRVH